MESGSYHWQTGWCIYIDSYLDVITYAKSDFIFKVHRHALIRRGHGARKISLYRSTLYLYPQSVRIFPRPSPQKSQIGAQRFICIFVYFNLIKMRVGCRRWRNPRLIAARGFWIHVRATSCEWIVYGKHLFTWFESARHWNWVFNSRRRVYFVQQRSHF